LIFGLFFPGIPVASLQFTAGAKAQFFFGDSRHE
jgi:hypothetical protein